jgi:hypothetical protein
VVDFVIFFIQFVATWTGRMPSRWRYLVAFLLTDLLVVVTILIGGIYSYHFRENIEEILSLFTTGVGLLLLLSAGLAGAVVVRLMTALKL